MLDKRPLVSIIIPTYNREFCIGRAIKSVISQTFSNWELIIVDNNSTDNTIGVVNDFSDARISIEKIKNDGVVAKSRNRGVQLTNGKFVAFLDSDDWWEHNKLEVAVKKLLLGSDLVYHDLYIISKTPVKSNRHVVMKSRSLYSPVFVDLLKNGNAIWNSSVVVRRSLLEKIGGLSEEEDLVGSEDFDGWLRIAQLSEKFDRLESVLGYYWNGGGNLTSAERTLRNNLFLRKRYANVLMVSGKEMLPGWLTYALARASLRLKNFSEARRYATLTIKSDVAFILLIKSLVTWLMAVCKFRY